MSERKQLKDVGIRRTSSLDNGNVKVYYIDGTENEMTIEEFLNDFENPTEDKEV